MKVSVLIPIYGAERYIEKCAHSLFSQSYESIEFIFVDDCSPDDSILIVERVLEEYPHQKGRTKILHNEVNQGVSASRNRAIDAATGHFILFVDADDWCSEDMIEQLAIEQMEHDSDVVTSAFYAVSPQKQRVVNASPIGGVKGSLRVVVSQSFDLPNRIWGVLIRRDIILKHKICFDSRITMGEDYLFLVQILYRSGTISHLSNPIYYYRVDVGMSSKIGRKSRRNYIRAVAAARSFLKRQEDYAQFSGALRLSRFNLRRWLLLRNSGELTPRSAIYRAWCYSINGLYHLYCKTFNVR